ncbi:hypothetical protein N5079_15035 [Planotetraspora sp. A-T 1434]|uniref:hypothetical protein n=1 Tax=Planotetraspora sp. A-T 1434 TaxID=2979219 RepID=UPI0021C05165|nr:hypothetical protein [Planotetraspora sp. A-T 1434]MCT9931530.1 hypothetical protein [Planotetraspora sp. A-T 1434]
MSELIVFIRARLDEAARGSIDDATSAEALAAYLREERDLAAKRGRLNYLAHILGGGLIDVGERAQAEHLLRLEAAAYDWHPGYRDEWRP